MSQENLCAETEALEKLFEKLFNQKEYKKSVRPTPEKSQITRVESELKLLQIDLVIFCLINDNLNNHFKCFIIWFNLKGWKISGAYFDCLVRDGKYRNRPRK